MNNPVIDADGTKKWFMNGKFHSEDGPAVEYANGTIYWWLNDKKYKFNDWLKLTPISNEEKCMMKLTYG